MAEDGSLNYRYEALLRSFLRTFRSSFVARSASCFACEATKKNEAHLALRHEARLASRLLRLASRHFASLRSAGATETVMASLVQFC